MRLRFQTKTQNKNNHANNGAEKPYRYLRAVWYRLVGREETLVGETTPRNAKKTAEMHRQSFLYLNDVEVTEY